MNKPIIRMQAIHKDYHIDQITVQALRGIDLEVACGEFVAILGPSGSGKSTLMSLLGCLDIPDSGQYLLDGNDVAQFDDDRLTDIRNKTLGFVFQNFNLLQRQTAFENIETPLIYAGISKAERADRANAFLELVGLAQRARHTTSQLSGGQQQRVAIARALVNKPAILLADEPTGNLDSESSNNIMALLEDINQQGVTIVLITHEAAIATRAHRRLYLHDGRLREHA